MCPLLNLLMPPTTVAVFENLLLLTKDRPAIGVSVLQGPGRIPGSRVTVSFMLSQRLFIGMIYKRPTPRERDLVNIIVYL